MKSKDKSLEQWLFSGRYEQIIESANIAELSDVSALIAAMNFTGRVTEAQTLFDLRQRQLPIDQLMMARFFMVLGLVRTSAYAQARNFIAQNLRSIRQTKNLRAHFYAYQGLAFYRYFCGRWESGLLVATKAFNAAFEDDFSYGKILASDLRGHLLAQVTNVDEGIRYLGDAVQLARTIGNEAIAQAAEISILSYEAHYGLRPQTIVQELQAKLKSTKSADTYSQAALLLELARQLMIRGKLDEVRPYLDQAAHLAYMFRNRRQEATFNLRLAYLNLVRGENYQALSFTQAAERCLDRQVDRGLELAALGLQHRIVMQLGLTERATQLEKELQDKSIHHGNMTHVRMLHREMPETFQRTVSGSGDRLGLLRDTALLEEIVEHGYLQFLYDIKGWPREERAFALDVIGDTHVVLDKGRLHTVTGLTTLGRKVLLALANQKGSKEALIKDVWGYQYDPLRHDALIYNAVNGLRRIFGQSANWIETTEDGYRLLGDVKILSESVPLKRNSETILASESWELNSRQLSFLKRLKSGQFAHVKQYQKMFHVSEITACRDLAMLHRKGYLIRVGRARATRYALPGETL